MPVSDSIYTDPEALRLLYRNPRNVLGGLADVGSAPADVSTVTPPFTPPVLDIPPVYCPAVGQYILAASQISGSWGPMRVEHLVENITRIVDPITWQFAVVEKATRISDVDCAVIRTVNGAESIVSLSDLVITGLDDLDGRPLIDLIQDRSKAHTAVSVIEFKAERSEIESIWAVGKRDVIAITLRPTGRYASGSQPFRMTVRHNKSADPPDIDLD